MRIIDFHCHPFRDDSENLCFYKEALQNKCDEILDDMGLAGVSYFCGSVIKGNVLRQQKFTGFDTLHSANPDALYLKVKLGSKYLLMP